MTTATATEQSNNDEDSGRPDSKVKRKVKRPREEAHKSFLTSSAHEDSSSSEDDDEEEPILNEATLEKQRVATQALLATSFAITAAEPQASGTLGDNQGAMNAPGEELKKDGEEEDGNIVIVCGLRIDIEKITDQEMYALRKVLPRKEYR